MYFLPRSICFNLLDPDSEEDDFRTINVKSQLEALTDYGKNNKLDYMSNRPMNYPLHALMKEVIANFDRIRDIMIKAEKHKNETYILCESYMKRAKVVTTPFRVLKELL
ncbi:MAG: hypothetical protein GKC08_05660 [Methanosarcinales archaeon]|nr:hypothetical protein [Methanosarcinales archaeon]